MLSHDPSWKLGSAVLAPDHFPSEALMNAPANPQQSIVPPADIKRIMVGLMLGMLLSALDMTIVGPALPTIGHDLGQFEHLPWVVTSYLLVSTAFTPLYGKMADIYGRRIMLLVALGIFVVGSVACALSPSMLALILARGLQGVGGGGIMALSMTIIGDLIPPRERVKYQVYTSMVWVVSNIAGPVLGGYFAEKLHWSMIFWINVPLGFAAWIITSSRLRQMPRHERPHKLDLIGALLMMLASTLLMLALTWGGTREGWTSPLVLSLFAGAAATSALLVWRLTTTDEPLIPLSVLANKVVFRGMLAMFFAMGSYIALSIYVPIYFQAVQGLDVGLSGLAMVPLMFGTTCGSVLGMRLMPYVRRYLRIAVGAMMLALFASLPLAWAPGALPFYVVQILLFLIAVGIGPMFPLTNVSIQSSVPLHELGTTTALVTFMRSLGASLGVAVVGTVVVGGIADHGLSGADAMTGNVGRIGAALAPTFGIVFLICGLSFGLAALWLAAIREPALLDRRRDAEMNPE
jgi:EmrB/QacA subfamily drug resistance transporter